MRAERDRRATILTAEGVKQSQILTAEGEKQSAVLRAEGQRTSAILKSEGEAKAIETVFQAIHDGAPDPALLQYQYLQMLPQLAQGDANKIWVIPSEFSSAAASLADKLGTTLNNGAPPRQPKGPSPEREAASQRAAADAAEAEQSAHAAAEIANSVESPGAGRAIPAAPSLPAAPPEDNGTTR
jgi:hypothetical protein